MRNNKEYVGRSIFGENLGISSKPQLLLVLISNIILQLRNCHRDTVYRTSINQLMHSKMGKWRKAIYRHTVFYTVEADTLYLTPLQQTKGAGRMLSNSAHTFTWNIILVSFPNWGRFAFVPPHIVLVSCAYVMTCGYETNEWMYATILFAAATRACTYSIYV